jgi:hypothetical protein
LRDRVRSMVSASGIRSPAPHSHAASATAAWQARFQLLINI